MRLDFKRLLQFVTAVVRRFNDDGCLRMSAALSYTALLSLVPLVTVVLLFLSTRPEFESIGNRIIDLALEHLMPTSGQVIHDYLLGFTSKASKLTLPGIFGLLVTALMTLFTIDMALNTIWRSTRHRNVLTGFLVYWAILTLGPFLIGGGFVITSYLTTLSHGYFSSYSPGWLNTMLIRILPGLLETAAFTMLYLAVPRARVQFKHALVGGVLAAVLFELAKKGFVLYVTHFPGYEAIYGAFSAIPIFLLWVYISWAIILLGAQVVFCLSHDCLSHHIQRSESAMTLVDAYRVVGLLWEAQQKGEALAVSQLSTREPQLTQDATRRVLERLQLLQYVIRSQAGRWVLSRDLHAVSLHELYEHGGFMLPTLHGPWRERDVWNRRLAERLDSISDELSRALDVRLADMYLPEQPTPASSADEEPESS
ncbi:MAG: YihY family inner membrane protein [Gammaproteobacteria bacterium]